MALWKQKFQPLGLDPAAIEGIRLTIYRLVIFQYYLYIIIICIYRYFEIILIFQVFVLFLVYFSHFVMYFYHFDYFILYISIQLFYFIFYFQSIQYFNLNLFYFWQGVIFLYKVLSEMYILFYFRFMFLCIYVLDAIVDVGSFTLKASELLQ